MRCRADRRPLCRHHWGVLPLANTVPWLQDHLLPSSSIKEACPIDGKQESRKKLRYASYASTSQTRSAPTGWGISLSGVSVSILVYRRCYPPPLCQLRFTCTCGVLSPPSDFLHNWWSGFSSLKDLDREGFIGFPWIGRQLWPDDHKSWRPSRANRPAVTTRLLINRFILPLILYLCCYAMENSIIYRVRTQVHYKKQKLFRL